METVKEIQSRIARVIEAVYKSGLMNRVERKGFSMLEIEHPYEVPKAIYNRVKRHAEERGWTVIDELAEDEWKERYAEVHHLYGNGTTAGAFTSLKTKTVVLNPAETRFPAKFWHLLHEVGHTILTPKPMELTVADALANMLGLLPFTLIEVESKVELFNYYVREGLGLPTEVSMAYFILHDLGPEDLRKADTESWAAAQEMLTYLGGCKECEPTPSAEVNVPIAA